MLSIYVTDHTIEYVAGKAGNGANIAVSQCGRLQLPAGIVEKGSVVNKDEMVGILSGIKDKTGVQKDGVTLIFNSTVIVSKMLTVPLLSEKKMRGIINEELREFLNADKEYVFDYASITGGTQNETSDDSVSDNNINNVMGVACERKLMQEWEETFHKAGIKLTKVDVTWNVQDKLVEHMDILSNKAFIMAELTGNYMGISIYDHGKMLFFNNYTIGERGNLGFITDASRILSQILQFVRSEDFNNVDTVYFCGMQEDEKSFCGNISNTLGMEVKIFPESAYIDKSKCDDYLLSDYVYPTGNLYRRQVR